MFARAIAPLFPLGLALLLFNPNQLVAQASPVEVVRVDFQQTSGRDRWIQATVELRANQNPLEDARSRDFLDNITVDFFASWQPQGRGAEVGFDFYRSSVRIISMRRGERRNVVFLLPSVVVDRDRLNREPFAYLVELDLDGNRIPLRPNDSSPNLRDRPDVIEQLKTNAASQASRNDGILIPHYLAPEGLVRLDPSSLAQVYRPEPR